MSCPPDIAEVILEVLQTGLLRICARDGREIPAALPVKPIISLICRGLLSNYSPELLRYYWEAEKPAYCNRDDGDPRAFAPAWERLHHLLKRCGIA